MQGFQKLFQVKRSARMAVLAEGQSLRLKANAFVVPRSRLEALGGNFEPRTSN